MQFKLDMTTMFLALVIGHLFTAVLLNAYWRNHSKDQTVRVFFYAKCMQAVAWLLLILRGGISDIFTISLANTFLFLSNSLEIIAVLKLLNVFHSAMKKIYTALTFINIAGFQLILIFFNEENTRIMFASIGTAAILVIPAYLMLRDRTASLLVRVMGCFYLFVIATFLGRAVLVPLSENSMSFFAPGNIQSISFLVLYLVMISGNTGFVLMMKERADKELLRFANYDDLTGVLNRRTFVSLAKTCMTECVKKRKPVSLLLFDVDRFKQVNDTFGHDAGDRVLQDLAGRIKLHLGSEDLFARYGGDEFAILLPGRSEEEASAFAEGIRKTVEETAGLALDETYRYTISLGVVTTVPDPSAQLEALYTACDKALYDAKRNGRNTVSRGQL